MANYAYTTRGEERARVLLFLVFIIELLFWNSRACFKFCLMFFFFSFLSVSNWDPSSHHHRLCVCVWHFKKGEAVSEIAGCPFACPYANGGSAERERGGNESIKRVSKGLPSSALTASPNAARKEAFYN